MFIVALLFAAIVATTTTDYDIDIITEVVPLDTKTAVSDGFVDFTKIM